MRADDLPPGRLTPSLRAHRHRFRARLDARRGDHDDVERDYREAESIFARHGLVFHCATALLEHAEWLAAQGRADDARPLLAEARATFEHLEAAPWLDRLAAVEGPAPAGVPA